MGDVFVERNQKTVADENYPLCSFIAHKGVVPKTKYDRSFLVKSDDKKYKRTELNDFIYSSNNLETGSIGLNKFGNATISPVYSVFMVNGNSDFIAGLATTHRFIYEMIRFRQGVVYGQWRIHESDFLKIKYYIPQVLEQEKIGNVLSELDRTITLHEEKKKQLESLKSALLQKLFADKSGFPFIRFKGYSDAWEQRKLGEILQKNTERNKDSKYGNDKTISISKMQYNPKGTGASSDSLTNYKVIRIGDVAFEGHTNQEFQYGRFVVNDLGDGIMSPRFSVLRPVGTFNISYWKQYLHCEKYINRILVRSTKAGTMMNELVYNDLFKEFVHCPSSNEQQKIGKLLTNVDRTITLHDRKLKLLRSMKKALLQKMFI